MEYMLASLARALSLGLHARLAQSYSALADENSITKARNLVQYIVQSSD